MDKQKLSDEPGRLSALQRYQILDTPPAEPFDKITALVKSVMKVPIAAVSLIDTERQWFKSIQGLSATETPRSVSFCSHAIKDVKPLVIEDATEDPRFSDNPLVTGEPHIRSYAGAPLRTPDGYNVGALCAIDILPRTFTGAQLDILSSFASLVVDELELRRIAERDHLTGAFSRRGFLRQTEKEIERFRRGKQSSVLAVMDLDHFKAINDEFGHPSGDAVLKGVAAICNKQLRENDAFGRLGGEEFGILLSGTDKAGGMAAIEKIRRSIEQHQFSDDGGLRVTASFGLAALQFDTAAADTWIAEADEALYSAKRLGRNRCVSAEPAAVNAAYRT